MAGEYEHIRGKGNRFTSENQPANRGRKPKLYTLAKKGYGIGFDDFKEVAGYLMQLPKKDVEAIAQREDTPIWVVNVCRALHKDSGRGVIATLKELAGMMWGKEMASKIDIKASIEGARPLTMEEAKRIISEL